MKKKVFSLLFSSLCLFSFAQAQSKVKDTTLYYASDRYEIRPEYKELLDEIIEKIKLDTAYWVEVSGHADIVGSKVYNENLSLKRTETVLKYFYEEKVGPKRIKGYHYGSAKPVASNSTKTGRKRNRRVEVVLFKGSNPNLMTAAAAKEEYVEEPRVEIDIHYNRSKFVYLVNGHRNILHTVRDAEVIFDTNCFVLPKRTGLYGGAGKLRLDFSEMDKKGEFLFERIGLRSTDNNTLQASYIFCLDSISSQGAAHIRKGREVEFLIPSNYVSEGSKLYYSPDHVRTVWKEVGKPTFNSLHNSYVTSITEEGCYAVAKPLLVEVPTNMEVAFTRKPKELKNKTPEFFFVYKEDNTLLKADSVSGDKVYFRNLKSGAHGTIVGLYKGEFSSYYYAHHDVVIKHHGTKTYHPHAHLKFKPVSYFEFDKLRLDIHSDNKK